MSRFARGLLLASLTLASMAPAAADETPRPLLAKNKPVDWWFVFKFNSSKQFGGCGRVEGKRACPFGGEPLTRPDFGQQFAFASKAGAELMEGKGCLGATMNDPVGATFDQVYNGNYFYVLWNDQFYGDPRVCGKGANCTGRWGHSKGMMAWNESGEGFVMQVTTPSWPGSGSKRIKRKSGNTLGCVSTNNNLRASQHFFALKLNKADVLKVLAALKTANVATDVNQLQVVSNGGPADVRAAVLELGKPPRKPANGERIDMTRDELSTGAILITKPPYLFAPPWQLVSAELGSASQRAATWWTKPWIYSTSKSSAVKCWPKGKDKPGAVKIALTGEWADAPIKLNAPANHAKIGTAEVDGNRYVIFGDLNQQGSASPPPDCDSSQNGRGGMFFVLKNADLHGSLSALIQGNTAVLEPGPKR